MALKALDAYFAELAEYVLPGLCAEILRAEGLPILAISYATCTSEGYAYSLQTALRNWQRA